MFTDPMSPAPAITDLGRECQITPTQFLESINAINEILISAHSLSHSCLDNILAFFTLQFSRLVTVTHYEKVCPRSRQHAAQWILISAGFNGTQEMSRLHQLIDAMNKTTFNPVGLNIVWPRNVAFIFVSDRSSVVNVIGHRFCIFTAGGRILCMSFLSASPLPCFEPTRFGQ